MALTLTVGIDMTNFLAYGSLTVKFGSADFELVDPTVGWITLGRTVTIVDPAIGLSWSGTISVIENRIAVQKISGHHIDTVTALSMAPAVANTAPFDLSDVAASPTDILTTEAGDELITETGSSHLLTEGPRLVAYQDLSIRYMTNLTGPVTYTGRATVWQPGLAVGQTFQLYCADLSADVTPGGSWYINQLTTTWPVGQPVYLVEFGLPGIDVTPVTLRHLFGLP